MTYREFYTNVANGIYNDEMVVAANEFLAKIDERNDKRKGAMTKDKAEANSRRESVLGFLKANEGQFTRDQIAEAIGISASQVTGACTVLVNEGLVTKTEIKVEKSRKVAYALA